MTFYTFLRTTPQQLRQEIAEQRVRLHQIYSGREKEVDRIFLGVSVSQAMQRDLGMMLEKNRNLPRIALAKQFMLLYDRYAKDNPHYQDSFLSINEPYSPIARLFNSDDGIVFPVKKLKRALNEIHWRSSRIDRYCRLLGSEKGNFPSILRVAVQGLLQEKIDPQKFGYYLDRMMDIAQYLPPFRVEYMFTGLMPLFHTGHADANFFSKTQFNLILSAVREFSSKTKSSVAWGTLMALMSGPLSQASSGKWPDYIEGFADVIAKRFPTGDPEPNEYDIDLFYDSFRNCMDEVSNAVTSGTYQGKFSEFLGVVMDAHQTFRKITNNKISGNMLWTIVRFSRNSEDFNQRFSSLCRMVDPKITLAEKKSALNDILDCVFPLPEDRSRRLAMAPLAEQFLTDGHEPRLLVDFLGCFHNAYDLRHISDQAYHNLLTTLFSEEESAKPSGERKIGKLSVSLSLIRSAFYEYPELFESARDLLFHEVPDWGLMPNWLNATRVALATVGKEQANPNRLQDFRANLRVYSKTASPAEFLNHVMLNRERIHPNVLRNLFHHVENTDFHQVGRQILPELLALLSTYSEMIRDYEPKTRKEFMESASLALTRLYGYFNGITGINNIQGIVLNNWAKIGELGLSFPKWQFDAMQRWRGLGPMQAESMLVKSGQFKTIETRKNDSTFSRGFLRQDTATGLAIELRRAYIVISKPGLGTLVIRNSSPVFGRNLLPEPAYFHPTRLCTGMGTLFDPQNDLEKGTGFMSVMDKEMNGLDIQQTMHERIASLLETFETSMEAYVDWKCGFKDGIAPAGFRDILYASMMSAVEEGRMTPFSNKKRIKPAWINRFGLPFPVSTFDVSTPEHQQQMKFYLDILEGRRSAATPEVYRKNMPDLLNFLSHGLEKNLELVLTE